MPEKAPTAQHQPSENQGPRLLTVAQVAAQLQVARDTVYRLVKAGQLRPVFIGKSLRISTEDLDAFIVGLRRDGKAFPFRYPSDERREERRKSSSSPSTKRAVR